MFNLDRVLAELKLANTLLLDAGSPYGVYVLLDKETGVLHEVGVYPNAAHPMELALPTE